MRTHCPYCVTLEQRDGAVAAVGDPSFDVNAGELCTKGFSAAETLAHPERLLTPLVRRDGVLVEAGWDEALDAAHQREGIRAGQIRAPRAGDRQLRL